MTDISVLALCGRTILATCLGLGLAAPVQAQDMAADGEKVFRRCSACHEVGPDAQNKVGPQLNALIGRTAGSLDGYAYSTAMVEAGQGGLVWTEETLVPYLTKPRDSVPGTKMAFAGLRKPEEITAVIAYIVQAGGGD
ncbi:cytochrome c family protein [Paracoccus sediminis]|uniref:Cytochrome c n=1 Tax=Paracoccus sediminis TaxID=1214787 RepID=A0A238YFA2_9RHOB|nr:cytochrome c family protein [Paracoccus sediminis]TBN46631.1 cytochrome c family protein [Paracoccus sediminis]SNR69905.1 cytochrome c [Paracoccus sediminis]